MSKQSNQRKHSELATRIRDAYGGTPIAPIRSQLEELDIEGAYVNRRIDTPVVVVEYNYWNRRNEPRRAVRRAAVPATRDRVDTALLALQIAKLAKEVREERV